MGWRSWPSRRRATNKGRNHRDMSNDGVKKGFAMGRASNNSFGRQGGGRGRCNTLENLHSCFYLFKLCCLPPNSAQNLVRLVVVISSKITRDHAQDLWYSY